MADLYNILNRSSLILEKIQKAHYPSKKDLKAYLEAQGEARSDRTIDRALEALRTEFGIEICYDQQKNGYYIDWDLSLNPNALYRFLEQGRTLELLKVSANHPKEVLNCIQFEEEGHLKGLEHLQPVIEAILQYRKIRFSHAAFGKPEALPYTVAPYLLKAYHNRWYLICIPENTTNFRFFGIDRIQDLEVLQEHFVPDTDRDPKPIFNDRIGISLPDGEMEMVELSCDPFQGNYLKTLPLHPSQEILKDDEDALQIRLYVEPNFELRSKIMEIADSVKVIRPEWLATEIQNKLKKALNQYQSRE